MLGFLEIDDLRDAVRSIEAMGRLGVTISVVTCTGATCCGSLDDALEGRDRLDEDS